MKEEKQLNVLNDKLNKLMLRKTMLQQKSDEFKSKYGTRNTKLTITQLKAKESLKEKFKKNNTKIREKKTELKKMMTIVKKKGGGDTDNNERINIYDKFFEYDSNDNMMNTLVNYFKMYMKNESYDTDSDEENNDNDQPKTQNSKPERTIYYLQLKDLKKYIDIINKSIIYPTCNKSSEQEFLEKRNFIVEAEQYIDERSNPKQHRKLKKAFGRKNCKTIDKKFGTRMYYMNQIYEYLRYFMMNNGKFLGQGTYGCVFHPVIPCNDNTNQNMNKDGFTNMDMIKSGESDNISTSLVHNTKKQNNYINKQNNYIIIPDENNFVSKVFNNKQDAELEFKQGKKIKEMDIKKEFTIVPVEMCELTLEELKEKTEYKKCTFLNDSKRNEKFTQIIYNDKGIPLDKYNELTVNNVLDIAEHLIEGVKFFKDNNMIHHDIKPDNIVMTAENKPKYIDFGLSLHYSNSNYFESPYEEESLYESEHLPKEIGLYKAMKSNIDISKYEEYFPDFFKTVLSSNVEELNKLFKPYKIDIFSVGKTIEDMLDHLEFLNNTPNPNEGLQNLVKKIIEPDPRKRMTVEKALETIQKLKNNTQTKGGTKGRKHNKNPCNKIKNNSK